MNKTDTYTSTGKKFLKKLLDHPNLLRQPRPLSLQLALTEKCNLSCVFCSVVNRKKVYKFNEDDVFTAVTQFAKKGTKTVEITGGGEPLMFKGIDDFVRYCVDGLKLKVGLITNGTLLHKHPYICSVANWIRISMNCLDYVPSIHIPEVSGTLGFSYCWNSKTIYDTLDKISKLANVHGAKYVRVVPNCLTDLKGLQEQHKYITEIVQSWGHPFFYQQKEFGYSRNCWWGYYKPFLYCDGYVYPCSSTVLNSTANKKFAQKFRICHWTKIDKIWNDQVNSSFTSLLDTRKCDHCVFHEQNRMIEDLKSGCDHEDFI